MFLDQTQSGFRKGRLCIDSDVTLKVLLYKRREYNLATHFLSLGSEKPFDQVIRRLLLSIYKRKHS